MNLKFSLIILLLCFLVLVLIIYYLKQKIKTHTSGKPVNLSIIWIYGLILLFITVGLQYWNLSKINNNITDTSTTEEIAIQVKRSLQYSILFLLLFISTIFSWFLLYKYRKKLNSRK